MPLAGVDQGVAVAVGTSLRCGMALGEDVSVGPGVATGFGDAPMIWLRTAEMVS
jgi:hypothetical protein